MFHLALSGLLAAFAAAAPAGRADELPEAGSPGVVYVIPIEGMIEPALLYVIRRGVQEADRAQAGAVTAALFLQRFAPKGPWVHLDIFAWNARTRPGWSSGAEAQAIRALYRVLKARYS